MLGPPSGKTEIKVVVRVPVLEERMCLSCCRKKRFEKYLKENFQKLSFITSDNQVLFLNIKHLYIEHKMNICKKL